MTKRNNEKTEDKLTIVGGQPARKTSAFSGTGVENFLLRVSLDEKLKKDFLEDRKKVMERLEFSLTEQDKILLFSVPSATLERMLEKFVGQRSSRRAFLKGAAASIAFLATGMIFSACNSAGSDIRSKGISPDSSSICGDNMKLIAKALKEYADDHDGLYPSSLEVLTEKGTDGKALYLEEIPSCPVSEKSYSYISIEEGKEFKLCCNMEEHIENVLTGGNMSEENSPEPVSTPTSGVSPTPGITPTARSPFQQYSPEPVWTPDINSTPISLGIRPDMEFPPTPLQSGEVID